MTLAELCRQMPRIDADQELKHRSAEIESLLRRLLVWGRRRC